MYGGQHPITIHKSSGASEGTTTDEEFVVVGHCCESGDLLTCAPGQPDRLSPLHLPVPGGVQRNDLLVVGGSGAYCSSMNAKNYNSFPEAAEVLVDTAGELHVIRR